MVQIEITPTNDKPQTDKASPIIIKNSSTRVKSKCTPKSFLRHEFILFLLFIGVIIISWINCVDKTVWWMEAATVLIGVGILIITYPFFRFTPLVYYLVFIEAVVMMVGAHYTYEKEPVFEFFKEKFHLSRNYYDRVGHFFQGFTPAIIIREVLLRKSGINAGMMLSASCVLIVEGISAIWEIIEWLTVRFSGNKDSAFLGLQGRSFFFSFMQILGDEWDAQEDMLTAIIGAICSIILLTYLHNRQLRNLTKRN